MVWPKKVSKVAKVEDMDEEKDEDEETEEDEEVEEVETPKPKEKKLMPSLKQKPATKKVAKILRKTEEATDTGIITTVIYLSNDRIYESLGNIGEEFNLD